MEAALLTLNIGLMILLAWKFIRIDRDGKSAEDLGIFSFNEPQAPASVKKKSDA